MIVLISGLFAFMFTLKSIIAVNAVSIVGLAVSLEFFLHTYRFRHIAMNACNKLREIEHDANLHTMRQPTFFCKMKVPTGSMLLCFVSWLFISLWLIMIFLFNFRIISV